MRCSGMGVHMAKTLVQVALLAGVLGPSRTLAGKWINSFAGPFVSTLGPRFDPCLHKHNENLISLNLRVSQFRNHALEVQHSLQRVSGNATLRIPLDSKGSTYMKAATRSNNQWKENAFVFKFPGGMCRSTMEVWPDVSRKLYRVDPDVMLGKGPCIVPKGVYLIDNEPINWTVPKLDVFPYGTWRMEVGYLLGERNVMCFMVEIVTQPKL